MLIFKIVGIGIIGMLVSLVIRQYKPEIAVAVPIVASVSILLLCIPYLSGLITMLEDIAERSGIDNSQIQIVIKIIGVAYVCQFAADICKDAGESAVSGKIELGGKIIIIVLSMPIIYNLLALVSDVLNF